MTENHRDSRFIKWLAGAIDDISNANREDMINALKETVSVLEKKQDDPHSRPFET